MPRSQENSSRTVAMTAFIPHLPGAESFMEYLVDQYHGCLSTRLVASTESTETWDILCRDKPVGTYFRSGKNQGYPLRTFDGNILGYVNATIASSPEPRSELERLSLDRVHLEFNTASGVPFTVYPESDFVKYSVRKDGHKDIPFP